MNWRKKEQTKSEKQRRTERKKRRRERRRKELRGKWAKREMEQSNEGKKEKQQDEAKMA